MRKSVSPPSPTIDMIQFRNFANLSEWKMVCGCLIMHFPDARTVRGSNFYRWCQVRSSEKQKPRLGSMCKRFIRENPCEEKRGESKGCGQTAHAGLGSWKREGEEEGKEKEGGGGSISGHSVVLRPLQTSWCGALEPKSPVRGSLCLCLAGNLRLAALPFLATGLKQCKWIVASVCTQQWIQP